MAGTPEKKRAIGGFLPLETSSQSVSGGILELWGIGEDNAWMFSNARSALAHLLCQFDIQRLILPAYICPELALAARNDIALLYYPLLDTLSPKVEFLRDYVRHGDCVVGVDYFGRQPDEEFRAFVAGKRDVLWVEDRAQGLMPAAEPWADLVLYSPRKLFGVPDGGILVRTSGRLVQPQYAAVSAEKRALPRIHRRQDSQECDNQRWYEEYRRVEENMAVSSEPVSDLTRTLLTGIDPMKIVRRRQANFDVLANLLPEIAFFPGIAEDFAPLGFPVRLDNRDAIWKSLCDARIFPARYWPSLPSDPDSFAAEHQLSREILVLPCDQRYDGEDMRTVATAVRNAL